MNLHSPELYHVACLHCQHCDKRIESFGGVYFERHHSAVCYSSPDTQHRPYGVAVPERKPAPDARPARRATTPLTVQHMRAAVEMACPPKPPPSVIKRGADTTSTHGASGRKRWN